jgi:putative endonuclease
MTGFFVAWQYDTRSKTMDYWVYILHCENGNYYTGYTTDLSRRYAEHVAGTAKCKYTSSFKPLSIAHSWPCSTKSEALKLEKFIKQMSKQEKENLLKQPDLLFDLINL